MRADRRSADSRPISAHAALPNDHLPANIAGDPANFSVGQLPVSGE
jgi:hypothetical protein